MAGTATSVDRPTAGRTRIHPWVSYITATLFIGGSLALLLGGGETSGDATTTPEFLAAQVFFERNPDVELTAAMQRLFGADRVAEARAANELTITIRP